MTELQQDDRRVIRAWTFYDWANSVYPLVITSAIFPNFYDAVTATKNESGEVISHTVTFFGSQFQNQNIYTFVYAFSLAIVVLLAPVLSGIADFLGNKKRFLQFFCYLGSLSCICLYFFQPQRLELSFIPFIMATIGYWGSVIYYNSYLPQIASHDNQDRVSARGFALGYFGSSLLLILCLAMIIVGGPQYTRYTFILVGLWWLGFAQITFRALPNRLPVDSEPRTGSVVWSGFRELRGVTRQVMALPMLRRFLGAFFFFNMGVQTILVLAVLFARNEIVWPDEQTKTNSLIISILLIQFVGVAGSFAFSKLSAITGNIRALMVVVLIWIFVCVFAYSVARTPSHFYVMALLLGFVMGGVQSLSRSTYSKLLPPTNDHASFFSFYDVMEKLGMIIGTVTFATMSEMLGDMRTSILSLMAHFLLGFTILFSMRKIRV